MASATRPDVSVPSLGVTVSRVGDQITSGGLARPVTTVSRATGSALPNRVLLAAVPRCQLVAPTSASSTRAVTPSNIRCEAISGSSGDTSEKSAMASKRSTRKPDKASDNASCAVDTQPTPSKTFRQRGFCQHRAHPSSSSLSKPRGAATGLHAPRTANANTKRRLRRRLTSLSVF